MTRAAKAGRFLLALAILVWAGGITEVSAVILLSDGDVLVTDGLAGAWGGVIRANDVPPLLIYSGGDFFDPHGMTIHDGKVLVADSPGAGFGGIVWANDPDGLGPGFLGPRLKYFGGDFERPRDVAVDMTERILVADPDAGGIIQADHPSGEPTLVYSGGPFSKPQGITVDAAGNIFVADPWAGGVIWANKPGLPNLEYFGGAFANPLSNAWRLAVDADGRILVTDPGLGGIIWANHNPAIAGWDPILVYPSALFDTPQGIAVDPFGNILVVDQNAFCFPGPLCLGGVIWANDPAGPSKKYPAGDALVDFGDFTSPDGIALVEPGLFAANVSEPGTLVLLGAGLAGLAARGLRRRRSDQS